MTRHIYDPRGLIEEAYRIEGIDATQCRAIFLDWAMGAGDDPEPRAQIAALLTAFGAEAPDHPMSAVLRAGLAGVAHPGRRRGGSKQRRG